MSRRSTIIVSIITGICLLVVLTLYAISDTPFRYRHKFARTFLDLPTLQQESAIELKNRAYYIAGTSDHAIYFGNKLDTLDVLITNGQLKNEHTTRITIGTEEPAVKIDTTQQLDLDVPIHRELKKKKLIGSYIIEVDSPYFYVKSGSPPLILSGTIDHWQASHHMDSIPFFTSAVRLGRSTTALATIGSPNGSSDSIRNLICKVSTQGVMTVKPDIFEGQIDNFYSTMGILRYSSTLNQLIYVYSYRNQYLVIDTLLNVIHKSNTVDPVAIADITPIKWDEWVSTLATPGTIVNNQAQIYKNLLFINSNLKASNEKTSDFDKASVVDVYDLNNRKYVVSFYIPDYKSVKMTTFRVLSNHIVALHEQFAVLYSLNNRLTLK